MAFTVEKATVIPGSCEWRWETELRQESLLYSSKPEFFKYFEADSSATEAPTVIEHQRYWTKFWRRSTVEVHTASLEAKSVFYFDIHVFS
jgi:hypothetical protein